MRLLTIVLNCRVNIILKEKSIHIPVVNMEYVILSCEKRCRKPNSFSDSPEEIANADLGISGESYSDFYSNE